MEAEMFRVNLLSAPNVICFLVAFFLLVGRWTPARVFSGEDSDQFYWEPRFWTVVALWVVILIATARSQMRARFSLGCDGAAFLLVLLLGYLGLTSTWSPSIESASTKLYEIGLIVAFGSGMWAWLRLGNNARDHAERIWFFLLLLTGFMAVLAVTGSLVGRQAVLGGGPNVFGRNMGLLAIVGISMLSRQQGKHVGTWASALVMVVGLLLVLTSGSRGALAAILVALAVYWLFDRNPLIRKTLIAGFIVVFGLLLISSTEVGRRARESFQTRVLQLTLEAKHTAGRNDLYLDAYEYGLEQPMFGMGLDGFQAAYGSYPHNIFLEIFCDGGQIALTMFVLALLHSAWCIFKIRKHVHLANLAAFVHMFAASQFSGDLYDSRGVFIFLGLALSSAYAVPRSVASLQRTNSLPAVRKLARS